VVFAVVRDADISGAVAIRGSLSPFETCYRKREGALSFVIEGRFEADDFGLAQSCNKNLPRLPMVHESPFSLFKRNIRLSFDSALNNPRKSVKTGRSAFVLNWR
jgi:hypothetical protein